MVSYTKNLEYAPLPNHW